MDSIWMYVLLAAAVYLIVVLVLYVLGKKELAQKLLLPLTALLGLFFLLGGRGGSADAEKEIRAERDRIQQELDALRKEYEALNARYAAEMARLKAEAAALEARLKEQDKLRDKLREEIANMQQQSPQQWFASLPLTEQQQIISNIKGDIKWED